MRAGIPSDYSDALSSRGFELEQRIAGGADGEVYLARQSKLRRRIVAIKFLREHLALDTKRRERFEREADILAQVNSRAVPFVLTRGAVSRPGGSVPYFVMENVDGRTLYDIVVKTGPLSLRRTIRIALDLLDALDEAHALQIVHRDVRPANVIVGERRTTLVDFSLGADRKLVVSPTKQGDGLGNWEYAAPEQKADAKTADHRCDLYSLGRTIRFMLTGSATAHPASPTEPPVIKDVLDRATAVKPDDRYASSRAFAEALKAISAYERPEGAIAGGWVICPDARCAKASATSQGYVRGPYVSDSETNSHCQACGSAFVRSCQGCGAPIAAELSGQVESQTKSGPDQAGYYCGSCGHCLFEIPYCKGCGSLLTHDEIVTDKRTETCSKCPSSRVSSAGGYADESPF